MEKNKSKAKLHSSKEGEPVALQLGMILLSVFLALIIGTIFILALDVDPKEAYYYLIVRPFTSKSSIGEISVKLAPILLMAVGLSFTFRTKLSNLGGEGQICLGAIGMTLVCSTSLGKALGWVSIPVGMVVAVVFGAAWAAIAGFFKTKFKASEIITTLMLNYIAVQLLSYLVYNPLRDPGGNIPQSAKVAEALPKLMTGSRMNIGILIALAGLIIYGIVIHRSQFGYKLRTLGGSVKAAGYGGISKKKYYMIAMLISGGFGGMAGAIELAGTQTRLLEGIAGSYGFDGVVASLLGMMHPIGVFISSVLLAGFSVGADSMQVKTGVPASFLNILEGLIVLFILLGLSFSNRKKNKGKGGE